MSVPNHPAASIDEHDVQPFDQQGPSFSAAPANARSTCSHVVSASLNCALLPCAVVLRRCGWLPASHDVRSDGDGDGDGGAWEPDLEGYEVLRLDEMEPAPATTPAVTTARPASDGAAQQGAAASGRSPASGRGYAPPRARPEQLQPPSESGSGLVRGVNAPSSSSSLLDTEPSSTLSSTHQRSGGERWVMQRGVLVKIGPDGLGPSEFAAPMNSRTRGRPSPQTAELDDNAAAEGSISRRAAVITEELERLRQPISRLSELTAILERCCRHLPLRIEVAPDHAGVAQTNDGALPFTLQLLGPLQKRTDPQALCPEALTVIEDILLDDCLEESLRLSCLHICDMSLVGGGGGGGVDGVMDEAALSNAAAAAGSNAFLDMLLSPTGGPQYVESAESRRGDDDGTSGTVSPARTTRDAGAECQSRLLVLLKNVMESRARDLSTLRFTRCVFSPLSIGDLLAPCMPYVRRLLFEQCPFSNAHVDALLQRAHLVTERTTSTHGAGAALAALEELQLCGALSPDAIQEVLRYFSETVAVSGVPRLRIVRLPFPLARAAREHPFTLANPTVKVEIAT